MYTKFLPELIVVYSAFEHDREINCDAWSVMWLKFVCEFIAIESRSLSFDDSSIAGCIFSGKFGIREWSTFQNICSVKIGIDLLSSVTVFVCFYN